MEFYQNLHTSQGMLHIFGSVRMYFRYLEAMNSTFSGKKGAPCGKKEIFFPKAFFAMAAFIVVCPVYADGFRVQLCTVMGLELRLF